MKPLSKGVFPSCSASNALGLQFSINVRNPSGVTYREYSRVVDIVRKHLTQLEAKPEHAVKKCDPELIVLIIQLHERFKEKIFVSAKDKVLLRMLKSFSSRVEDEVSSDDQAIRPDGSFRRCVKPSDKSRFHSVRLRLDRKLSWQDLRAWLSH